MAELYPDKTPEQLAWELSNKLESCELRSNKLIEALREIDALMNRLNPAIGNGLITDKIDFLIQQAIADFEGENKYLKL